MSATPGSRKCRPFASPSCDTISFRTRYRSQPSNKALFRIKFGPEPVSNTAENCRRLRGSGQTELDTHEVIESSRASRVWSVNYVRVYRFIGLGWTGKTSSGRFMGLEVLRILRRPCLETRCRRGLVFLPCRVRTACGLRQLMGLRRNCR